MKNLALLALLALVASAAGVQAQVIPQPGPPVPIGCAFNSSPVTLTSGQAGWVQCTSDGKLQVNASVSASISGFAPATTGTPISATTSGATGALPAGSVVTAFNVGTTNTAYCKLGASATTSDIALAPGSGWFGFTVGSATQMTCITASGTTTVNLVGGSGLPTGSGGGSGSTGGGGAVSDVSVALSGMTSNGAATQIALQGTNSVSVNLTGTWSATITPQVSNDGGTTWVATQFYNPNTQTLSGTTTANGIYDIIGTGGKTHARVVVSAYASGTVTGNLLAAAQAPSSNLGAIGTVSDAAYAGSGNAGLIAISKGLYTLLNNPAPDCGALASCPNLGYSAPLSAPKGGASPYHLLVSTASTNSTNVKGSAGTVYFITVVQTTTTLGDLRIYDSSTAPTCSSSTNLVLNIPIQSNAVSPGVHLSFPTGYKFSNGIGFCFTGAVADNDNTNWGGTASGVAINMGFN